MSNKVTRKVLYNPARKAWETVYPEDEGYENAIEMVWSTRLNRWVTIPQD